MEVSTLRHTLFWESYCTPARWTCLNAQTSCLRLQAIAEPDERYEAYCASSDFIREHVFPGGHLPSMGAMVEAARGTGLSPTSVSDIGPDYAVTLRAWRDAWERRRDQIQALGYSQRFWRKFRQACCSSQTYYVKAADGFGCWYYWIDKVLIAKYIFSMQSTLASATYCAHSKVCPSLVSNLNSLVCRRFYFAYCEAAFDAKYIHDYQITWHKTTDAVANLPVTAEAAPLTALPQR